MFNNIQLVIEHICVVIVFVNHRLATVFEEGEFNGEVVVLVETEERVDVDNKRGAIFFKEFDDLDHQIFDVWPELPVRSTLYVLFKFKLLKQ